MQSPAEGDRHTYIGSICPLSHDLLNDLGAVSAEEQGLWLGTRKPAELSRNGGLSLGLKGEVGQTEGQDGGRAS